MDPHWLIYTTLKPVPQSQDDSFRRFLLAFIYFAIFDESMNTIYLKKMILWLFSRVIYILFPLQIYPLQQFMNAAQLNITLILPLVLSFTVELLVSIKRVEEFINLGKFIRSLI